MATDFGSQLLYEDARNGDRKAEPLIVAARIELEADETATVLPPTLDKLLNGVDTMPSEDDAWANWEAEETPPSSPPPVQPKAKRIRRRPKMPKFPINGREVVSVSFEITGMSAVSLGFWQIAPWCGLIVGGLCLILIGMAVTRNPDGDT